MMERTITNSQPPDILVIDDDESICEFFQDLFLEMGLQIDTVRSGAQGLEMVRTHAYNLIFLDIMLGSANGLDILMSIKSGYPRLPVIMISGYLTEENIEKALRLGADGYLYKPLTVRDILSKTLRFIPPRQLAHLNLPPALKS